MKILKWTLILSSSLLVTFLVSCDTLFPKRTDDFASPNGTAMAAASTLLAQTISPVPTLTIAPTNTPFVPTSTAMPTWTPLPFQALDGLRVAYIVNGDLYIQDSGQESVKLTFNGGNSHPVFSDDGQKIAFTCAINRLCTINADGSDQHEVVTPQLLSAFGKPYSEYDAKVHSPVFIPGTHRLVFSTGADMSSAANPYKDLFLVDADTGALRQLRASDQGGRFVVSPDGKKIAIETLDHIDVINSDGQILRRNLVTHAPIDATYGIWWAEMFWVHNSSELVVLTTDIPPGTGVAMIRTVWRYPLDGRPGAEIKFDPPPSGTAFSVSPDGNWIAYTYTSEADGLVGWLPEAVTWDAEKPVGVYLGSLQDGTSQLVYTPDTSESINPLDVPNHFYAWNSDSTHYLVDDYHANLYLGTKNGEFVFRGETRGIGLYGWIDNTRYLLQIGAMGEIGGPGRIQVMKSVADAFVFLEK